MNKMLYIFFVLFFISGVKTHAEDSKNTGFPGIQLVSVKFYSPHTYSVTQNPLDPIDLNNQEVDSDMVEFTKIIVTEVIENMVGAKYPASITHTSFFPLIIDLPPPKLK